jgi:hypothetical protein
VLNVLQYYDAILIFLLRKGCGLGVTRLCRLYWSSRFQSNSEFNIFSLNFTKFKSLLLIMCFISVSLNEIFIESPWIFLDELIKIYFISFYFNFILFSIVLVTNLVIKNLNLLSTIIIKKSLKIRLKIFTIIQFTKWKKIYNRLDRFGFNYTDCFSKIK